MRTVFAIFLLASAAASAEELWCPDAYPSSQVSLPKSAPGQAGGGVVRSGALSDAYLYAGKLHNDVHGFEAVHGPEPKRVKGGWDTEYSFEPAQTKWPKWLVCVYGGNELSNGKPSQQGPVESWEPISPRLTHCVLQVRAVKQPYHLPNTWSAVARCKGGG